MRDSQIRRAAMRKTAVPSAMDLEFHRLARQFDNLIRQYVENPSTGHITPSSQVLLRIIRARHARGDYFPSDLFSDPAWDILLDLLHAHILKQNVCVSSVCVAANAPATTALRYLSLLEKGALVKRTPDPCDGRRCFVSLTVHAEEAFAKLFAHHPLQDHF